MQTSILTEQQAAEYLGLSPKTLQARRHFSRPPRYIKLGRSIRYRLADLDSFITENLVTPCQMKQKGGDDDEL